MCCYEDQIWAIGGTNGWKCLTETEMYDSQSDTWSPGPPLNIARRGPGIAVFNGEYFAIKRVIFVSIGITYEPQHEISNNVVCATSKATDQLAHTRSLIRAFASRLNIL